MEEKYEPTEHTFSTVHDTEPCLYTPAYDPVHEIITIPPPPPVPAELRETERVCAGLRTLDRDDLAETWT